MSKLKQLIDSIKTQEEIIRFKELENIIDHNEEIQKEYTSLLNLQKDMVAKEFKKHKDLDKAKERYEIQKTKIMKFFILEEYLDLLDIINDDLNLIKDIIETEINLDLTTKE